MVKHGAIGSSLEGSVGKDDAFDDPVMRSIEEIQAGIRVEENSENLYRTFRATVRSFFLRKGFSPQESDDLTQDVFLRIFKGIDTFRRDSRFERWLWEVTSNIYLNELRRRRAEKREAWEESLGVTTAAKKEAERSLVSSLALSPEEEIAKSDRAKALRAALEGLPDQMRRCCILRYERGLKYQEIATVMKISVETVKSHLHQARKRLMALLGDGP